MTCVAFRALDGGSGNRFPRRSWVPGYHVADVDALIDRG
jgi:hypothetical protein